MIEIEKTTQYQVQQKIEGCIWSSVMYPDDLETAEIIYKEHVRNYPNTSFRIIKIETIKSVVNENN